jgi:DNA-directed RNA polymerase subunit RPC12/RpoP
MPARPDSRQSSDKRDFSDEADDGDLADEDEDEPTVPCPYCRREIPEDAVRCPYCEHSRSKNMPERPGERRQP